MGIGVLCLSLGIAKVDATPLSTLIGLGSNAFTINNVTFGNFGYFDELLDPADASKIDVTFVAGSNWVGFDMHPLNINDNPWKIVGPSKTFDWIVDYSVSTIGTSSTIDGSLVSATYSNKFSQGIYLADAVRVTGLSSGDINLVCGAPHGFPSPIECFDTMVLLEGGNFSAIKSASLEADLYGETSVAATGHGSPDSVELKNFEQIFLTSPVTIRTISNQVSETPGASAVLSNGTVLRFPVVPEPSTWILITVGLAVFGFCKRK